MYDIIMTAIDGSPTSQRALDEAMRLATALGSRLVIAHVIDNAHVKWDLGSLNTRQITDTLVQQGHTLVAKALHTAQQAGIQASTVTTDDPLAYIDVATELEKLGLQAGAQVMVLGTHGRRGVRRALLGSVAESVVRSSSLPVLLVR
ncbi:universal stress protein [Ralstonia solanacearum]|uniref:Universal stress protein n=1 Tax=Ralstonia solanacearum TaxID=305 RepID=A0AAW5ZLM7_RALSL|nr:universal stress protein [Ralstonia solanacearum]MDB0508406.1 universal stress protein [Ralstonia solanacearum]MDB0513671.1 universal stress protein [Ralstonia solanacearum]MDB0526070.1 universal stress protein [Ralstonia solanacearum]MDB0565347.1 universal stress protein [Ralstonia solanacearum]MDB0570518.1 universal stress protein [Ralstonia solanacearum]